MTVHEILTKLYRYTKHLGEVPLARDKRVNNVFKEAYRKIGTGRKALFIAGAVPDQRQKDYPQMTYVYRDGEFHMDEQSAALLKRMCVKNHVVKERIP